MFRGFFELLRPVNCLMAAIGAMAGAFAGMNGIFPDARILLAMVCAFAICGAGQAINDYFDLSVDRKKNPLRPIPSGKVSHKAALFFSLGLFASGMLLAGLLNTQAFAIAAAFSGLLFVYSWKMKKVKILGNIVVSLATASTLLFGASVAQNYSLAVFFAASAFFASMGREITKDAEDKKPDEGEKKSIAHILAHRTISLLAALLYAVAFTAGIWPWFNGTVKGPLFALFVSIGGIVFLLSAVSLMQGNPGLAQRLSKAGMILSLAGFVFGVV
ncbi:MAG: geranylgeranylglycerol-phosphate geranylgeranyltransferase [Candidatus Diapherotrites archaeon]|nr:geranylgeranylglycerol-phosphate geranylgeranyltransferase [Candidatus Diapherotrites archaeon]